MLCQASNANARFVNSNERSQYWTQTFLSYQLIKAPEDRRPPDAQSRVRPQPGEYLGHLHSDVAGAHHHHAPRPLRKLEEAVAGDTELGARDVRDQRAAPDSDQDVVSGVDSAVNLNPFIPDKLGQAFDDLDLGVVQIALIDPIESLDVSLSFLSKSFPVKSDVASDAEAVVRRVLHDLLPEVTGAEHQLLWNTPNIDTGASESAGFYQPNLKSKWIKISLLNIKISRKAQIHTLTPNSAALLALAIPPDPPPRTRYSKCFIDGIGGILK